MAEQTRILRIPLNLIEQQRGPSGNVTFGYQSSRDEWSIWYEEGEPMTYEYLIIGTGCPFDPAYRLVSTVVMPDGFHTFHLLRKHIGGSNG